MVTNEKRLERKWVQMSKKERKAYVNGITDALGMISIVGIYAAIFIGFMMK